MGNWNSGRRPKSTTLKLLRGITRRDRLNLNEPTSPPGEVVKPADLSPGAITVWEELAPICLAMGTLTDGGRAARSRRSASSRSRSRSRAAGKRTRNTLVAGVKLEKIFAPIIRNYYDSFGLTPVSRPRIKVPKADETPVSKWAGVLT